MGRRAILIEENAPHLMVESPSTWTADELRTLFHGLRLAELDERGLDNLAQILSSVAHHENLPARRLLLAVSGAVRLVPRRHRALQTRPQKQRHSEWE